MDLTVLQIYRLLRLLPKIASICKPWQRFKNLDSSLKRLGLRSLGFNSVQNLKSDLALSCIET